jgi:hypothetical protein
MRKPAENPDKGMTLDYWPLDDGPFEDEEHAVLIVYADVTEPIALRVSRPGMATVEIALTIERMVDFARFVPKAVAVWNKWWESEIASRE